MSYSVIAETVELILSKQGLRPRELPCFELDKTEKWDTLFQAEFQSFHIKVQATRGVGKLTSGTEDQARETPGFAALWQMDENDLLVFGKILRIVLQPAGYRLKAWEKGRFRDHQWVAEQPLDGPHDDAEAVITSTEAPKSLDLVRVKFEKRQAPRP